MSNNKKDYSAIFNAAVENIKVGFKMPKGQEVISGLGHLGLLFAGVALLKYSAPVDAIINGGIAAALYNWAGKRSKGPDVGP